MSNQKPYRYPGATPFSTDQKDVFFGRKGDTEALLQKIRREPMVLLHSKSGLGKSSLLNAGIIPLAEDQVELVPVPIRFRAWVSGRGENPLSIAKGHLKADLGGDTYLNGLVPEDDSLWLVVKSFQVRTGKRVLIIFDQFEELFTYPAEEVQDFQREVAEVLNTGIPLRFRRKLDQLADKELSEEDEDTLYDDLNTHMLFAIRSDRLALLENLKKYLPNIMRHSYELKALTRIDAEEAIVKPASAPGDFATPAFTFEGSVVTNLLNFLEDPSDCLVEGILLQMLCEHYESKYVESMGILHLEEIGDPAEVVRNYYQEKVKMLPEAEMKRARILIEDGLVSKGEGMRLSLHESFIQEEFQVGAALLTRLEDSRLLRREPFARGGYTYELSHDRLVPAVVRMRDQRQEAEAQKRRKLKLAEERKKAKLLEAELEKEAMAKARLEKRNSRIRLLLGLSVLLMIASAFAFFYALNQRDIAQAQGATADSLLAIQTEALNQVSLLQQKNEKIIEAFYFYDGHLALAVKDFFGEKRYGFIDTTGTAVIPYEYSFATPFDENGFAQAEKIEQEVVIDSIETDKVGKGSRVAVQRNVEKEVKYILDASNAMKGNLYEYRVVFRSQDLAKDAYALDLRGTNWQRIPSGIGKYPDLTLLFLDGTEKRPNAYSSLPSELKKLVGLNHFSCSNGRLKSIPKWIENWEFLSSLNLSYNNLGTLPEELANLIYIERLDLSSNTLSKLPEFLGQMYVLSHLDVANNQLKELPWTFGRLDSLGYCNLGKNMLGTLPQEFNKLQRLSVLKLDDNMLKGEGIAVLWDLESLIEIDLSGNLIERLPFGIGNLKQLTQLGLSSNSLVSLPEDFGGMEQLLGLDLSFNNLVEFPLSITELDSLTTLSLGFNDLKSLPAEIGNLNKLTSLDLVENELKAIPPEIGNLVKLKELDLSGNDITELPEEIGKLTDLKTLDLARTSITRLPESIKYMKSLTSLNLLETTISEEEMLRIKTELVDTNKTIISFYPVQQGVDQTR